MCVDLIKGMEGPSGGQNDFPRWQPCSLGQADLLFPLACEDTEARKGLVVYSRWPSEGACALLGLGRDVGGASGGSGWVDLMGGAYASSPAPGSCVFLASGEGPWRCPLQRRPPASACLDKLLGKAFFLARLGSAGSKDVLSEWVNGRRH